MAVPGSGLALYPEGERGIVRKPRSRAGRGGVGRPRGGCSRGRGRRRGGVGGLGRRGSFSPQRQVLGKAPSLTQEGWCPRFLKPAKAIPPRRGPGEKLGVYVAGLNCLQGNKRRKKQALELKIPFPSSALAKIALGSLAPDPEPRKGGITKELNVTEDILHVQWRAEEARILRVSISSFLEHLSLVVETMDLFGPPMA